MSEPSAARAGLFLNGLLLLLAGLLIDPILGRPFHLCLQHLILLVPGVFLALVSFSGRNPPPTLTRFLIPLPVLVFSIGVVEVVFRGAGYDFGRELEALRKIPVYYRQPRIPDGDIYFRREGPAVWEGDVLADGNPVTVAYDSLGFRNPPEMADWEVVVIGDSFVEMGYLPLEELFTAELGRLLDVRVKNLGVSHVGPLTYTHYLSTYGKAPSTTDAVCVFFEGNDLEDLQREADALETYRRTGERPLRVIKKHSSFLRVLAVWASRTFDRVRGADPDAARKATHTNAFIAAASGTLSVGVECTPPNRSELSERLRLELDSALARWSRAADDLGLRPWLAYMPCSRRVLHRHLVFEENAPDPIVHYAPSDLPDFVSELCRKHGIRFIDLGPPLERATAEGALVFNLTDKHLSRSGGRIVAETLAAELSRIQ